jgi:hypothetical protein
LWGVLQWTKVREALFWCWLYFFWVDAQEWYSWVTQELGFFVFWGTLTLFFIMAILINIPTNSIWVHFLHLLPRICYFRIYKFGSVLQISFFFTVCAFTLKPGVAIGKQLLGKYVFQLSCPQGHHLSSSQYGMTGSAVPHCQAWPGLVTSPHVVLGPPSPMTGRMKIPGWPWKLCVDHRAAISLGSELPCLAIHLPQTVT